MNIGVLGTGIVGRTISAKFAGLGHDVNLGTRDVAKSLANTQANRLDNLTLNDWRKQNPKVKLASFADAAKHGEIVFSATSGKASLEALNLAGEANLNGKILVDISNVLDYSRGEPPSLWVSNTDSLAEQIQRAFPHVKVVKSLNTVSARVMVDPRQVADGEHHVFVSGNDTDAKVKVTEILTEWFGWKHVIDLGDITTARYVEMYHPLWMRLMGVIQTPFFNIRIVR